jgi:outer membrane receptor protein involved in Fe transport
MISQRRQVLAGLMLSMAIAPRALPADIPPAGPVAPEAQPSGAAPAAPGSGDTATLGDIDVVAKRLNAARSQIQPSLGATTYQFSPGALATLPQGDNAPLNQVLLQAPGVAQDSFGQFHLRGDHANVQFRLDGVQLPEGLSVFGQALDTRFADTMQLITGALPAQYGFQQAGVVDIQTKDGITDPGGEISMYGGSRGVLQPSFSYGGSSGPIDYFVTGDYLHTGVGIENPTASYNAVHDTSQQFHGLLHLSGIIDPTTRISLIAGSSNSAFQIPNNPGQTPTLGLNVNGVSNFNSADLNERQREHTQFGILSLQKDFDTVNMQVSAFTRYSSLYYSPDPLGDLLFDGIAQSASRQNVATGLQSDASWTVDDRHTIRGGFLVQGERTSASTDSQVLPVNAAGVQTSSTPLTIDDGSSKSGDLYGIYVQDEWKLLSTLTLNYGARFDAVNEYTHENQISPRINAVWQATPSTTIHAGYSRYFTPPPFELVSPSTLGLFANTTAAPSVNQDSTVKAERSHYFDAGISQVVLPGLTVGVDAYYKLAKNLIDEGQFGAPIILTVFNYARAVVKGVELTTSYDRGPWSFYGNLAYSRAMGEDIDSAQFNFTAAQLAFIKNHFIFLDHDQRCTSSGGVAYTLNMHTTWPTRLSVDMFSGSGLRADNPTTGVPNGLGLPSYAVVDLSAVQKLDLGVGRGTELRFDVLNVADAKYEIRNGTGVGVGAPQFGLRRTLLAGLTQRF